jgi:hypothetical protein
VPGSVAFIINIAGATLRNAHLRLLTLLCSLQSGTGVRSATLNRCASPIGKTGPAAIWSPQPIFSCCFLTYLRRFGLVSYTYREHKKRSAPSLNTFVRTRRGFGYTQGLASRRRSRRARIGRYRGPSHPTPSGLHISNSTARPVLTAGRFGRCRPRAPEASCGLEIRSSFSKLHPAIVARCSHATVDSWRMYRTSRGRTKCTYERFRRRRPGKVAGGRSQTAGEFPRYGHRGTASCSTGLATRSWL